MSETNIQYETASPNPFVDEFGVGNNSMAYITRMRQPVESGEAPSKKLLVGDVLRRTCQLGGEACAACGCQAPEGYKNDEKLCSDLNLQDIVERLEIDEKDLFMVGVTADEVGFYDQPESYNEDVSVNSVGIRELRGYNAFFASANENVVLGARLADCGFAAIEFQDDTGDDVIGFIHLTRTNLQGESKLKFKVDDKPAGSFEYFMNKALEHYGADLSTARVHLISGIKGENSSYSFKDAESLEKLFPGWYDQGLLTNKSNPDWQPGDEVKPDDEWKPNYREMIRWQIMRSGITAEQFSDEDIIDPGDLEIGHASNHAGAHGKMPAARDAYLVKSRSYICRNGKLIP